MSQVLRNVPEHVLYKPPSHASHPCEQLMRMRLDCRAGRTKALLLEAVESKGAKGDARAIRSWELQIPILRTMQERGGLQDQA